MHAFARTAATVAVALAAGSAAGCSASDGPRAPASSSGAVTSASRSVSSAGGGARLPSSVPRDYVTIDPVNPAHLIVRATATGAVVATVSAPRGTTAVAVYGNGDGATFAVATMPAVPNPGGGQSFYLLRLRSGKPAPLQRLSVGRAVGPGPTAVALSPDGTKIAMAFTYRISPPSPQPLTLYSTATGAVLRTWTVASGIISAADPMANGDLGQDAGGTAMRWTANGRGLAFAFHANAAPGKQGYGYDRDASIRVLDTTFRGGDLIARSRLLLGAGPGYIPSGVAIQCLVSSGWSPSADGRAVTCAAKWGTPGAQPTAGARPTECTQAIAGPTTRQQWNLGFWRNFSLPGGGGGGGTIYSACLLTASSTVRLLWAGSDGTTVLGELDRPGHPMFGLFRAGTFRALPPPPAGIPLSSIAW